jgi:pyrroline-5-carboxylate reductase
MENTVIGFLGAGQMARALAGGFVRAGLAAASDVVAHDPRTRLPNSLLPK